MEGSLTESQAKTAKSCFNMFNKWVTTTEPAKGHRTVAHYLKACMEGYPRGTKINPSLLRSRLKGIINYTTIEPEAITITEKELTVCDNLITKYRKSFTKNDEN